MIDPRFVPGLTTLVGPTIAQQLQDYGHYEALPGGASRRTYHRIGRPNGPQFVVMLLPDNPMSRDEATAGAPPTTLPFVEMQAFLEAAGVPVPILHRYDQARGHLWLEDLGDTMLKEPLLAPGANRPTLYLPAIELLLTFQRATQAPPRPRPSCYAQVFDPALLRWELDHYREWRVEKQLGRTLTPSQRSRLDRSFDQLVSLLSAQPQVLCHRDFQSTNLMLTPRGLVLIDFQDALMGPWTYDLVALLRDSYVPLRPDEVSRLVGRYLQQRPALNPRAFHRDFRLQTVQRKLKDAGRFVYIDAVKGDPGWLPFIADSLRFVRDALEGLQDIPALAALAEVLAEIDPEAFAA